MYLNIGDVVMTGRSSIISSKAGQASIVCEDVFAPSASLVCNVLLCLYICRAVALSSSTAGLAY